MTTDTHLLKPFLKDQPNIARVTVTLYCLMSSDMCFIQDQFKFTNNQINHVGKRLALDGRKLDEILLT